MSTYEDRTFQLWEYRVSHGSLLIRSPKGPGSSTKRATSSNVDLVGVAVEYLAVPTSFRGLELAAPTAHELGGDILGGVVAGNIDVVGQVMHANAEGHQ